MFIPEERPLRIAHVDAEMGFSGGERQVFLLLEGLRDRGHHNLLLCPPGSAAEAEAKRRDIQTHPIRLRNDFDLLGCMRLRRILADIAPSIVHLHTGRATWLGAIAARSLGLPALSTRRMDRPIRRGARMRWLYGTALDRTAAIAPAVARQLREGGADPARVVTISSAVDPAALRPRMPRERTRAALRVAPETPVLLAAAALVKRKGLDVLLEAMSRLSSSPYSARLWIAGEGPERGALETLAADLGLSGRVDFLGRREDVADLLAASDVFVLVPHQEGLGVAALEAMAVGKPVVATRVGGLAEAVVHDRTGWLVPPGDPAALAEALARLVGDRPLRARLGAAGPARIVEGFRADQMVESYERLYREVLAARPPATVREHAHGLRIERVRTLSSREVADAIGAHERAIHSGGADLLARAEKGRVTRVAGAEGDAICVKEFLRPRWNERIQDAVTGPRARDAWLGSRACLRAGVGIATPLAWAARAGHSYYLSRYVPDGVPFDQYAADHARPEPEARARWEGFLSAAADFVRHLHAQPVRHRDLAGKNVLVCERPTGWHFVLLDLNDVRTGQRPTQAHREQNLIQIGHFPVVPECRDKLYFYRHYRGDAEISDDDAAAQRIESGLRQRRTRWLERGGREVLEERRRLGKTI